MGALLFSGTWNEFSDIAGGANDGGRTTIVTGMDASSAVFGELELQLQLVSGSTSYQAMDNLSFGQVTAVPEPSSLAMIGVGLGATILHRRRKAAKKV